MCSSDLVERSELRRPPAGNLLHVSPRRPAAGHLTQLPDSVRRACGRAEHDEFPDDITTLKERLHSAHAEIERLKLIIAKLKRLQFGRRSEKLDREIEQLELQLEELQVTNQAARSAIVATQDKTQPARRALPEHLPRERIVLPGPTTCGCCGGTRLRKLGESVTETLEVIPRQWKVVQHVREKMTCRDCEKISEAPAPFQIGRAHV